MNHRGFLFVSLALLPACHVSIDGVRWFPSSIRGSGVEATEVREVPEFDRIEVAGALRLECRVGGARQVSVRGDDNLLPYVQTDVDGETLVLRMASGSYSCDRDLVVSVVAPSVRAVSVSGSADADVTGLQGGAFEASVSGSGSLQADGEVEQLDAAVSGSGDLLLDALPARAARVSVAGSGSARVRVLDRLECTVSGSGDVRYRGDPSTKISVSGSGSVTRR
ncbi:MAG: head GIN domain-containing protein [Planctomycetota bacterium]